VLSASDGQPQGRTVRTRFTTTAVIALGALAVGALGIATGLVLSDIDRWPGWLRPYHRWGWPAVWVLAGAKADLSWLGRQPHALALRFHEGLSRQQRVNWRVRYLEGDLTPTETHGLRGSLVGPLELLSDQKRAGWLARLDQVSMVSDGYLPFPDNVDHARRHGVRFITAPVGSIRDDQVADACRQYQIRLGGPRAGLRRAAPSRWRCRARAL
jgi:hypothetical protein